MLHPKCSSLPLRLRPLPSLTQKNPRLPRPSSHLALVPAGGWVDMQAQTRRRLPSAVFCAGTTHQVWEPMGGDGGPEAPPSSCWQGARGDGIGKPCIVDISARADAAPCSCPARAPTQRDLANQAGWERDQKKKVKTDGRQRSIASRRPVSAVCLSRAGGPRCSSWEFCPVAKFHRPGARFETGRCTLEKCWPIRHRLRGANLAKAADKQETPWVVAILIVAASLVRIGARARARSQPMPPTTCPGHHTKPPGPPLSHPLPSPSLPFPPTPMHLARGRRAVRS